MALTDVKIRSAKPKAKSYKIYDSNGLFVLVHPSGSKLWRLKYQYLKKERLYAVGSYPDIGLKEAREIRDSVKKLSARALIPPSNVETPSIKTRLPANIRLKL